MADREVVFLSRDVAIVTIPDGYQSTLAKGQEVTPSAIFRLTNFATTVGVTEPIHVIVPVNTRPGEGHTILLPPAPLRPDPRSGVSGA